MATSADRPDLASVSRALHDRPSFLAGWLAATPSGEQLLRDRLGLSEVAAARLLLCKAPRPQRFTADVQAVAEYVGVDPTALAAALREATVLAALPSTASKRLPGTEEDSGAGLLAAARDTSPDQLPRQAPTARVKRLAEETWMAAPAAVHNAGDVEAAVVWASPVMVIILPRLELAGANRWLAERGAPTAGDGTADLQGLLVAWRGQGVIFLDGTLSAAERRFVLAHEHGHFLLDYLEPRSRILRDAPGLLAVVDGHRQATSVDRSTAALARVRLGVHTHLLHRDDHGGVNPATGAAEDEASLYALELLAPWESLIAVLRSATPGTGTHGERARVVSDAVAVTFGLPVTAARARAIAGLAALGIRPGFFDR